MKENGLLKKYFVDIYSDLQKGKDFSAKKVKLLELRNNEFKAFKQDIEKLLARRPLNNSLSVCSRKIWKKPSRLPRIQLSTASPHSTVSRCRNSSEDS